jgi:hypothetical protein
VKPEPGDSWNEAGIDGSSRDERLLTKKATVDPSGDGPPDQKEAEQEKAEEHQTISAPADASGAPAAADPSQVEAGQDIEHDQDADLFKAHIAVLIS